MAVKIGSLIIQLAVEHGLLKSGLSQAEKEVKKTTREIEQTGRSLVDFGQKMAVAVTLPLAALAKGAVDGFIAQQKAIADVNAALASMGNVSGKTAAELAKTADQLEARSLYDAEDILKQVTANLLTFGRIAGTEFDRAQQAAIDLAARMDGDLKGATIQIGKALNDPIKGLTALSKQGIAFDDSQKAVIRSLVETGNVAAAQQIILAELEKEFRGAAAAAADATPWRAAQVAIGQAMDAIGEALEPVVTQIAEAVRLMAEEFTKLTPEMRQTIIVVAGVAAAIGPLLIVAGTLIQSTAGITAAFITMGPAAAATVLGLRNIALAATGLGGIVIALGLNFQETTRLVYSAIAGYTAYRATLLLITAAQRVWVSVVIASEAALWAMVRGIAGATSAKTLLSGAVATLTAGLRTLFVTMLSNPFTAVAAAVGVLTGAMVLLADKQRQASAATKNLIDQLLVLAETQDKAFKGQRGLLAAQLSIAEVKAKQGPGQGFLGGLLPKWALDAEASEQTNEVRYLREQLAKVDAAYEEAGKKAQQSAAPIAASGVAAEGAGKKIRGAADATKAQADAFQTLYDRLFPYQARVRQFDTELALIQKSRLSDAEKELLIARLTNEAFRQRTSSLGPARTSFDKRPEGPLVDAKAQFDELQKVLEAGAEKTKVQTVRIADTVQQMAERISGSLRSLVDGFKSGDFFDIFDGVVNLFTSLGNAGVFGGGVQSFLQSVPGRANGTAFHPGGLMRVGERGPEILQVPRGGRVVPNHELRAAGGGMAITITMDESTGKLGAFVRNEAGQLIATAAPTIAKAGASQALDRFAKARGRSLVA